MSRIVPLVMLAVCSFGAAGCSDEPGPIHDAADTHDAGVDASDVGAGDVATDVPIDAATDVASDAPTADPTLVVMSFNIKADDSELAAFNPAESWDWVADDEADRRDRVVAVIDAAAPSLICLQEARPQPVEWLVEQIAGEWAYAGAERGGMNAPTDMNPILWRTERFVVRDDGDFWLSETPDVPGSTFAARDDDNSRMASWVLLDDLLTDEARFVLCTHWSLDSAARVEAARVVRQQLESLGASEHPTLVIGDLNATEDSREYGILLGRESAAGDLFVDAYRAAHPERTDDEATFHGFDGRTAGSRIDFVLASPAYRVDDATIVRTSFAAGFPSDHYPVVVSLAPAPP